MAIQKTNYKLEYFPARYRAEPIRLILAYFGQNFKNVILDFEQWGKRKGNTEFGRLPILTVDGVELGQSLPICQFLARRYGLEGKTELEVAKVNAIADFQNDLLNATQPYIFSWFTNALDLEEQKTVLEQKIKDTWPTLIKILRSSKSHFFVDSGLTWVDFMVAEYTDSVVKTFPSLAHRHPDLVQHSSRIHNLPQLQEYLKNRVEMKW